MALAEFAGARTGGPSASFSGRMRRDTRDCRSPCESRGRRAAASTGTLIGAGRHAGRQRLAGASTSAASTRGPSTRCTGTDISQISAATPAAAASHSKNEPMRNGRSSTRGV